MRKFIFTVETQSTSYLEAKKNKIKKKKKKKKKKDVLNGGTLRVIDISLLLNL